MTELPQVDLARCRTAGDCVRVCPVGCLEMGGAGPRLARPGDCLACGLCAEVCPTGAVRLVELMPGAEAAAE